MSEMFVFGAVAMLIVIVLAGLLNRLLDFDELPLTGDAEPRSF
jgi:hypothetical protein